MCLRDGFDTVWIKAKGCKHVVTCRLVSGKKQHVAKCLPHNCGCSSPEESTNSFIFKDFANTIERSSVMGSPRYTYYIFRLDLKSTLDKFSWTENETNTRACKTCCRNNDVQWRLPIQRFVALSANINANPISTMPSISPHHQACRVAFICE